MRKTIVINLFGQPGAGKSTTAHMLMALMKFDGMSVEYVPEYAKELTWEERFDNLSDQNKVTEEQHRRLKILQGKVDYIVTDSPVLLGVVYGREYKSKNYNESNIVQKSKDFKSVNFFIKRVKKYNPEGRNQTEAESDNLSRIIKSAMYEFDFDFKEIEGNRSAANDILAVLMEAN